MQYQYVVILKRDSEKYVDRISVWVCCFSVLLFVYEQVFSGHFSLFLSSIGLLVVAGIIVNTFGRKKAEEGKPVGGIRYRNGLLLTAVAWLGMPYLQWISGLFFLLAFLEYQARYPLEIGFSDDRVVLNTLLKKRMDWTVFNNVVLRDGLLTLDFKNNRLFQKEVLDDGEEDADEDEFNDYCRDRLKKAGESQAEKPSGI